MAWGGCALSSSGSFICRVHREFEIRQGPGRHPRCRGGAHAFLGYRVEAYKLFVFTLSACMAGVAGALYVPRVGIINPSEFSPGNSIEAVVWVAVGGRGTLTGAVLGRRPGELRARPYFTSGFLAPYWLFLLGGSYVAVTLLLPRGIVGTIHHWSGQWRERRRGRRAPRPRPSALPTRRRCPGGG